MKALYTESMLICGKQLRVTTFQAQWYVCRHCQMKSSCKGRRGAGSSCPTGNHPGLLTPAPSRDIETIILLRKISQCTGHVGLSVETSAHPLPPKYHVECSGKYITISTESSQRPRCHQSLVIANRVSLQVSSFLPSGPVPAPTDITTIVASLDATQPSSARSNIDARLE